MNNKTVEEIIKEYLTKNEFHGLYNSDVDCACKRNDIAPCGGIGMHCRAGYLQPLEDDSEYDFVIGKVNHGCTKTKTTIKKDEI